MWPMGGVVATSYLLKKTVPWFVIGLMGAVSLFLISQVMRIAPVFVGADLGFGGLAWALFLLLVPVLGWALTPAMLFALFMAAGDLAEKGELIGFLALGISRAGLLKGLLWLSISVSAASAVIWMYGAPLGTSALFGLAKAACMQSIVNEINPGQIVSPAPGLTFFAEKSLGQGRFENVFVAAETGEQHLEIVAKSGHITGDAERFLSLRFRQGHLFVNPRGTGHSAALTTISFEVFDISHPLSDTLSARLDFIPAHLGADLDALLGPPPPGTEKRTWQYNLWRRVAMPVGCLLLSLVGVGWAFSRNWRTRGDAVTVALLLFAAYHLLARWGETLMHASDLPPPVAAFWPLLLFPVYVGGHLGLSAGIRKLRVLNHFRGR